jgi:hypothetical protein
MQGPDEPEVLLKLRARHPFRLLHHVSQLMGQQPPASRRAGVVGALAEEDVLTASESVRPERFGLTVSGGVSV